MTCKGKVKNGVVVPENGVSLPEDAEVTIELVDHGEPEKRTSWAEVFKDVIGSVDDMAPDMARNHDRYIHGTSEQ